MSISTMGNAYFKNRTSYRPLILSGFLILSLLIMTPRIYGFAGGDGSAEVPYLVETAEHLDSVRDHLGAHFRQIADIDLGVAPWNEGAGWEPIGLPEDTWNYEEDEVFTGFFDGHGHAIRNLTISRPDDSILGLFGIVEGGEIQRVVLEDVAIVADRTVGGLIGLLDHGLVFDCHSSGTIHVGEWGQSAGGLVGASWAEGMIEYSSSSAAVTGYGIIGGLVGGAGGTIRRSWATGPVIGSWYAGGLAGRIGGALIEDCYAMGSVTDPRDWGPIGGFAGGERWLDIEMSVRNCYATGLVTLGGEGEGEAGGLMGAWGDEFDDPDWILAELESCYWNTETSGQAACPGEPDSAGRTTAEMTHPHAANTYESWNFEEVWVMDTDGTVNGGYPYLRMPGDDPAPGPDPVSYEEWMEAIPDPEQRGDHDAPAGDNMPNLLKFASGLDPMTPYSPKDVMTIYVPGTGETPMAYMWVNLQDEEPESTSFAIVFYRSKTAAGVHLFATHTTDLVAADWDTDGVTEELIEEGNERDTWIATAPSGEGGYMRLQVERIE